MVVEALGLRYKTLRNHRSTEGAPPFLPLNNHLFFLCIIAKSCSWISSVCLFDFLKYCKKINFPIFFNQICDQFMNLEISFVAFSYAIFSLSSYFDNVLQLIYCFINFRICMKLKFYCCNWIVLYVMYCRL